MRTFIFYTKGGDYAIYQPLKQSLSELLNDRAKLFIEAFKNHPDFKERKKAYWEYLKKKKEKLEPYMEALEKRRELVHSNYQVVDDLMKDFSGKIDKANERGKEGIWLTMEDAVMLREVISRANTDSLLTFENIKHLVEL